MLPTSIPRDVRNALRPHVPSLEMRDSMTGQIKYRFVYRMSSRTHPNGFGWAACCKAPAGFAVLAKCSDPYVCALIHAASLLDTRLVDQSTVKAWLRDMQEDSVKALRWMRTFTPEYALKVAQRTLRASLPFRIWRDAIRFAPGNGGFRRLQCDWNARVA